MAIDLTVSRRSFLAGSAAVAGATLAASAAVIDEVVFSDAEIPAATVDEVKAAIADPAAGAILVDARVQEAYAGWALDGAVNGGHLKGAELFSARWFDCEYND